MDRLSIFLTFITGSILVGGLVTLVLGLGHYTWLAIAVAAGLGLVLTWPAAYLISRQIKREDPAWDAGREVRKPRGRRSAETSET
ncbi:MAG: hypothetical protein RIG84_00970 [Roseovarius sp.]